MSKLRQGGRACAKKGITYLRNMAFSSRFVMEEGEELDRLKSVLGQSEPVEI